MKKHKIRIIVVVAIVVVVLAAIFVPTYFAKPSVGEPSVAAAATGANRPITVSVAVVRQEVVLDGIRAVGSLRPKEQVDVSSEILGKVSQVLFSEGQRVERGDVLLKINDDDLQAQLKRYEYQLKTLSEKLERQRILLDREAVSQEAFDAVQTEYNVLRADIDILNVKVNRSTIRAPFSGVIGFRYVSQGAYLQPGQSIAMLVDYSELRLEFAIPEKYISMPLVGKRVFFTTEGSDRRNEANIYAVEPKVDDVTRTIVVRAMFNNGASRLRPGMSARIVVPTAAESQRLLVPSESIVPSMEGKSVWRVVNGNPVSTPITTGVRLEKDVELIKGLSLGDTIIINGIMQMREGAKIKIENNAF